jgi:hypothetical protein
MANPSAAASQQSPANGTIRIQSDLVSRASADDFQALEVIFRQFIPADERIVWIGYLGKKGIYFGRRSMACLTDKRVADISLGWFGEVIYQDAMLEYFNSTVVWQPSKLLLYLLFILVGLLAVSGIILSPILPLSGASATAFYIFAVPAATFLLAEFTIRLYYAVAKCGLILSIKEGVNLYVFCDRKLLVRVNSLLRQLRIVRDERIRTLGHIG